MTTKSTLITGGMRSGKSCYALTLAGQAQEERVFLATAQPNDEEMVAKIKRHKQERGNTFTTYEEPLYLAETITRLTPRPAVIVIDCMTLWVHNLMERFKEDKGSIKEQKDKFVEVLRQPSSRVIIVTNEVGLGIIPANRLARSFTDELGFLNQQLAQACDEVILMTCGIPQTIKERVHTPVQ